MSTWTWSTWPARVLTVQPRALPVALPQVASEYKPACASCRYWAENIAPEDGYGFCLWKSENRSPYHPLVLPGSRSRRSNNGTDLETHIAAGCLLHDPTGEPLS